jgi:hypothetical protein
MAKQTFAFHYKLNLYVNGSHTGPWASAGEGKGGLLPPPPGKKSADAHARASIDQVNLFPVWPARQEEALPASGLVLTFYSPIIGSILLHLKTFRRF